MVVSISLGWSRGLRSMREDGFVVGRWRKGVRGEKCWLWANEELYSGCYSVLVDLLVSSSGKILLTYNT